MRRAWDRCKASQQSTVTPSRICAAAIENSIVATRPIRDATPTSSRRWRGRLPAAGTDNIVVRSTSLTRSHCLAAGRQHHRPKCCRGSESRRARTCADGTAGTAAVPHRPRLRRPRDRARAAIAPAASARTGRRSGCASWQRCAADRCRRRCTARARLTSAASSGRSNSPQCTMREPSTDGVPRATRVTRSTASASEGPDVITTCMRFGQVGQSRGQRRESIGRPAAERVARADVQHRDCRRVGDAGLAEARVDARHGVGASGICTASAAGSGASIPSGPSKSH